MAECSYCKSETLLFVSNVPVCVTCADSHNREGRSAGLLQNVAETAQELAKARDELMEAHRQLDEDIKAPKNRTD